MGLKTLKKPGLTEGRKRLRPRKAADNRHSPQLYDSAGPHLDQLIATASQALIVGDHHHSGLMLTLKFKEPGHDTLATGRIQATGGLVSQQQSR